MGERARLETGSLLLEGAAGQIEAFLEMPTSPPRFAALVCHPNPLQGGTFDNKVVTTLARTCRRAGGAALRFNFRGVGQSTGPHGGGLGEVDDTCLMADWLRNNVASPLWLAGFSFGSMVAAHGATRLAKQGQPAIHLLLVAPPVHLYAWPALADGGCPVTIIQGEQDELVPLDEVLAFAGKQTPNPAIIRVPDCGHFFHGHLATLAQAAETTFP